MDAKHFILNYVNVLCDSLTTEEKQVKEQLTTTANLETWQKDTLNAYITDLKHVHALLWEVYRDTKEEEEKKQGYQF